MMNNLTVEALAADLAEQHPDLRAPALFDLAWHVIAKLNLTTDLVGRKPVQFGLVGDEVRAVARNARGRRHLVRLPQWAKG
jgi:hypothetical protein